MSKELQLYNTPPAEKTFNEVKEAAIKIANSVKPGGEVEYKLKKLENIQDNFMWIITRFGFENQKKLSTLLGIQARADIRARMLDIGVIEAEIQF